MNNLRNFSYIILFTLLMSIAQISFAKTSDLPHFKKNESYTNVRALMIKAGWKPFHTEDADVCSEGDSRCLGRPEMESCAGTGMANCKFLWTKNEKQLQSVQLAKMPPMTEFVIDTHSISVNLGLFKNSFEPQYFRLRT